MNAGPDTERLKRTISEAAETRKAGWVLSNHDFTRFATRFGDNLRAAATLFLSLPGPAFMFQGDELGVPDGPGTNPPLDRHDRDRFRHPMPWDDSPNNGFTAGTPWLPAFTPPEGSVAAQDGQPGSVLALFRQLIALRSSRRSAAFRFRDSPPQTILLERDDHLIAVNFRDQEQPVARLGDLVLEATATDAATDGGDPASLRAHGAWVAMQ